MSTQYVILIVLVSIIVLSWVIGFIGIYVLQRSKTTNRAQLTEYSRYELPNSHIKIVVDRNGLSIARVVYFSYRIHIYPTDKPNEGKSHYLPTDVMMQILLEPIIYAERSDNSSEMCFLYLPRDLSLIEDHSQTIINPKP